MIFLESLCHLLQRDNPRRCQNPYLAHSAAQHLADVARALNEFTRDPPSIEPTGAANPLLKQNMTESAGSTSSLTEHTFERPRR